MVHQVKGVVVMAKHCLYGIYATVNGKPVFGLDRNKKRAIKYVKHHGNGEVRSFGSIPGPEYTSFDAPTFRLLSERIYPKVKA